MNKNITIYAALIAAISVGIGAFGAHGLKKIVSPEEVLTFEVGVRYQMYHALAMLAVGLSSIPKKIQQTIAVFFVLGIVLFSGSIYLLVLDKYLGFYAGFMGFITPLGGVCFILGWVLLAIKLLKMK